MHHFPQMHQDSYFDKLLIQCRIWASLPHDWKLVAPAFLSCPSTRFQLLFFVISPSVFISVQPLYIMCVTIFLCLSILKKKLSATLSGLIALENATPLDNSPSTISFDGQMWLSPTSILTGIFRYYNASNISFPDMGQYFAWIHMRKSFFIIIHINICYTGCKIWHHSTWSL